MDFVPSVTEVVVVAADFAVEGDAVFVASIEDTEDTGYGGGVVCLFGDVVFDLVEWWGGVRKICIQSHHGSTDRVHHIRCLSLLVVTGRPVPVCRHFGILQPIRLLGVHGQFLSNRFQFCSIVSRDRPCVVPLRRGQSGRSSPLEC